VVSAEVAAGGARLFPIRLPPDSRLVLGVNGSPLMQMTVFGADGSVLEAKGPLRVVSVGKVSRSPVQLLITNEGVASGLITLSLRADPAPEPPPSRVPEAPAGAAPAGPPPVGAPVEAGAPPQPAAPPPVPPPVN